MKLVHHVPTVHFHQCAKKIVYCEDGEEALFPSASEIRIVERNDDGLRRDTSDNDGEFLKRLSTAAESEGFDKSEVIWPTHLSEGRSYFTPAPFESCFLKGSFDVVICPRKRSYGREKNWPCWYQLTEMMISAGLRVVAAGSPDASDTSLEALVPCTWQKNRYLDETIRVMNESRLTLATDNGLAHLAVWCAANLALVSYENGIVAPGPVRNGDDEVVRSDYWPINQGHYESENHSASRIDILKYSWGDPEMVLAYVLGFLDRCDSQEP